MTTAKDRGWGDPASKSFSKNITTITVAGISVTCHKRVAPLFKHLLGELARHYDLDVKKDDWGYANRPIRGYEEKYRQTKNPRYLSNHAWGLALDVNATVNPMTSNSKAAHQFQGNVIHPLLVAYRGRIVWGGDYDNRRDYMHFEFVGTPRDADVLIDQMGLD